MHFLSCFKAGIIEEFVNEAVDGALDSEDIEEETEEEVDKVLTELASETAAQLPVAARKEKIKAPAQSTSVQVSLKFHSPEFLDLWCTI